LTCETAAPGARRVPALSGVLSLIRAGARVTVMFCGFTIGSTLADLIASQVLEPYG
jgi:hypothetical protein